MGKHSLFQFQLAMFPMNCSCRLPLDFEGLMPETGPEVIAGRGLRLIQSRLNSVSLRNDQVFWELLEDQMEEVETWDHFWELWLVQMVEVVIYHHFWNCWEVLMVVVETWHHSWLLLVVLTPLSLRELLAMSSSSRLIASFPNLMLMPWLMNYCLNLELMVELRRHLQSLRPLKVNLMLWWKSFWLNWRLNSQDLKDHLIFHFNVIVFLPRRSQ